MNISDLGNARELFKLDLMSRLMTNHRHFLYIGMVTMPFSKESEFGEPFYGLLNKSALEAWKEMIHEPDKGVSIMNRYFEKMRWHYTSYTEIKRSTEFEGEVDLPALRNVTSAGYWDLVFDDPRLQETGTLVFLDPDLGLDHVQRKSAIRPQCYLDPKIVFRLRKMRSNSTLIFHQRLSSCEMRPRCHFQGLRKLFGQKVIFTGSEVMDLGLVIMTSEKGHQRALITALEEYYRPYGGKDDDDNFLLHQG